jgi:hypothetical protein
MKNFLSLTVLGLAGAMAWAAAGRADDDYRYGNPYRYYTPPSYYDQSRSFNYFDYSQGRRYLTYRDTARYPVAPYQQQWLYRELNRRDNYRSTKPSPSSNYGSPYIPRFGRSYYGSPYRYYRSPSYYGGYSTWGRPNSSNYVSPRGYSSFSYGR